MSTNVSEAPIESVRLKLRALAEECASGISGKQIGISSFRADGNLFTLRPLLAFEGTALKV